MTPGQVLDCEVTGVAEVDGARDRVTVATPEGPRSFIAAKRWGLHVRQPGDRARVVAGDDEQVTLKAVL